MGTRVSYEHSEGISTISMDDLTGGTFTPTMCHDGPTQKRVNTGEEFRKWMTDVRSHYGI